METESIELMAIFFKVLLGFILVNMFINFFLLYSKKLRIYKILAIYWPVLFVVYVFQSLYSTEQLAVAMAYSVNIFSCSIFAMIGFEVAHRKFPIKKYILYFLPFYPLTYLLYSLGYKFEIMAMPFAIATATPMLHAFFYLNIKDRHKTTKLQKFLGVLYVLQGIHCINFALFRMAPGNQIAGWAVAYVLYDFAAIMLPAIALERANMTENDRLQYLVDDKTSELNKSLKDNEKLLKVVIHDLCSPLMTMKFYLDYMSVPTDKVDIVEKAKKSHQAMENIILEVRTLHAAKDKAPLLQPVCLNKCLDDISFIFAQRLEDKNIKLIINNQMPDHSRVIADPTILTHSVLSNLISNGVKFTDHDSQIVISAKEDKDYIIIEVIDQGPGISEEIIQKVLIGKDIESQEGTSGELGSGYGLSIVKSFVESFGGKLEFESKSQLTHPKDHGTKVRLILSKTISSMQKS